MKRISDEKEAALARSEASTTTYVIAKSKVGWEKTKIVSKDGWAKTKVASKEGW